MGPTFSTCGVAWGRGPVVILETIAVAAVEGATSELTAKILEAILGRRDKAFELLQSMDERVYALQRGPHKTALTYLQEAALPDRTPGQVTECLKAARHQLMQALGQETDPQTCTQVCLELMLTHLALSDAGAAVSYGRRACVLLAGEIEVRADQVNSGMRALWLREHQARAYVQHDNWFPADPGLLDQLMPIVDLHNSIASALASLGVADQVMLVRILEVPRSIRHQKKSAKVVVVESMAHIKIALYPHS
jgi:hypothetical protein